MSAEKKEKRVRRILFAAILAAGLLITGLIARSTAREQARLHYLELHDNALHHGGELNRLLELYIGAGKNLAAFIGASAHLNDQEFQHFVRISSPFTQLPGLIAVGYLPRIQSAEIPAFEQHMRQEFPDYRVWARPFHASEHYPLAYAANPRNNPTLTNARRGLDYGSIIERHETMTRSLKTGQPHATFSHQALVDPSDARVVLLFTPVFPVSASGKDTLPEISITGFVYSVLRLDTLFKNFDQGPVRSLFQMQVFEETINPATLLYIDDQPPTSTTTGRPAPPITSHTALPLIHRDTLEFAGQEWLLMLYQKNPTPLSDRVMAQQGLLVTGFLLSVLAALAAVRLRRNYWNLAQESQQIERFAGFFEAHPFAVYFLDRNKRFTALNEKAEHEFGQSREQLLGTSIDHLFDENNRQANQFHLDEALEGKAVSYHCMLGKDTHDTKELSVVLLPITTDGRVVRVLGIAKNVTEKKLVERELYRSRTTMQLVIDNIPQLVFWKDAEGRYQGANRSMLHFSGFSDLENLIGKTDNDLPWRDYADSYLEQDRRVFETGTPLLNYQEQQARPDGRTLWLEVSKVPMVGLDGDIEFILGVVDDITTRKEAEVELARRANYDSLTGAANRSYFYLQLDHAMNRHRRAPRTMALLYFDIDEFKTINDTHGHHIGDEVIREFTRRVHDTLRATDLLARLGGDEFIVLVEDAQNHEGMEILTQRILSAMRAPFAIEGILLNVFTSIGVAFYREGMNADQWVNTADQALYAAKRTGRNRCVFARQ